MILTSIWNTTIAGSIYGLLTSSLIFFLTTLYNDRVQKKNIEQAMFKAFIEENPQLMIVLENANQNIFDYTNIRNATQNMHTLYLKEGEIRTLLCELSKINLLRGDEYRQEKNKIPKILKELHRLIKNKRDELL